jgi:hypothetical protein
MIRRSFSSWPTLFRLFTALLFVAPLLHAQDSTDAPPALPPLPPAGSIKVVLSAAVVDSDQTPIDPGVNFSNILPALLVSVSSETEMTFAYSVRLIAEDVRGVTPGKTILQPSDVGSETLEPGKKHSYLQLPFPAAGLPVGRYRVEVVDRSDVPRVVATTPFTAKIPELPPKDSLAVTLSQIAADRYANDADDSPDPKTDFPSWPGKMLVSVKSAEPIALEFTLNLFAETVSGLPANSRIGAVIDEGTNTTLHLRPDAQLARATLLFPRFGLPPGTYRLELEETNVLHRLIKTITFTTHATELEQPEFNLADADFGGLLESVTGEGGAGYSHAPRLLSRDNKTGWHPLTPPPLSDKQELGTEILPCELVFSFFQHEAALVSAVEFVSPNSEDNCVADVEIWGSMQSATEGFTQLAAVTVPNQPIGRVEFAPTSVKYIKVKIISKQRGDDQLDLSRIRVIEGKAPDYQPLAKRKPEVANWRFQPRHAAQEGLFFLMSNASSWQIEASCIGCHVQSQTLVGISVARKNDYIVSEAVERQICDFIQRLENKPGDISRTIQERNDDETSLEPASTLFSALGLAYAPHTDPVGAEKLLGVARWLVKQQGEDGTVAGNEGRAPIEQGDLMFTGNALDVWAAELQVKADPAIKTAFDRGLAFVTQAEMVTTQDKVFKILTFSRFGTPDQKKLARQLCAKLLLEQQPDGGWKLEADAEGGSTAFSTGQVLYACRLAGLNPNTAAFQKGVRFLLISQLPDGSWKDINPTTPFAATMWPVIALAGSFGSKAEPAHIQVTALPRPPVVTPVPMPTPKPAVVAVDTAAAKTVLPKTIELILDCSLSMDDRLGKSTRLKTAKEVLKTLIQQLPDDTQVGLRLYGHRYGSMTRESSTDTQLVVPIQPLNRPLLLDVIAKAEANGQTPLVYSTLQAGQDLKKVGGGTIVLVTDGEESCGGKPRKAGPELAALGVPLRLDIVGFTLTGKRVVDDLNAFVQPTGGRYYSAADGPALATALRDAVTPPAAVEAPVIEAVIAPPPPPPEPVIEDFPYEIIDADGAKVATTTTLSGDSAELQPGTYSVVLHDGKKSIALPSIVIKAGETIELSYVPEKAELKVKN